MEHLCIKEQRLSSAKCNHTPDKWDVIVLLELTCISTGLCPWTKHIPLARGYVLLEKRHVLYRQFISDEKLSRMMIGMVPVEKPMIIKLEWFVNVTILSLLEKVTIMYLYLLTSDILPRSRYIQLHICWEEMYPHLAIYVTSRNLCYFPGPPGIPEMILGVGCWCMVKADWG